jgi:hypothetical protein
VSLFDAQGQVVSPFRRPGWSRPIRVGVYVSYLSHCTVSALSGIRGRVEKQVSSTCLLADPSFQLISIVESGTSELGLIERTIRDHDLTGGLIDATDVDGLKTLDVLWLGTNFAAPVGALKAFVQAVSSGVGLLNEHWMAGIDCHGQFVGRELMLADSPIHRYHTRPRCGVLRPFSVIDEHPLLPGMPKGARFTASGCRAVYRPTPGTRVVMEQDTVISPEEHQIAGLGPVRPPIYLIGQIGLGRAVVVQLARHETITQHPSLSPTYLPDLIAWLAEPHRDA